MLQVFLLFIFIWSVQVQAEYRVFELEITTYSETEPPADGQPATLSAPPPEELGKRTVLSTLDPEQYRGYNIVNPNERVRYIATWRCKGRTSNKDFCPNPKVKTEGQPVAVSSEIK